MTDVDRSSATANLEAAFASVADLLEGLAPDEWRLPTALPGWDVQANAVHIFSTEAMLLGEPAPEVDVDVASLPHIRNDIGAANERWVLGWVDASPAEVLAALRDRAARRLEAIRAMDDAEWAAEGFTPAGPDTYGRFMRIRVMDVWMHEQDIREAVGRPGHTEGPVVEMVLDEIAAGLGFVVGKRAGAPPGSSVSFALTGPAGRDLHVALPPEQPGQAKPGRAAVVERLDGPATATLRTDVLTFTRLAGGRRTGGDGVELAGDTELAARVLAGLGYMI